MLVEVVVVAAALARSHRADPSARTLGESTPRWPVSRWPGARPQGRDSALARELTGCGGRHAASRSTEATCRSPMMLTAASGRRSGGPARPELAVARVAEAGHGVALRVSLAVERV